MPGVDADGNEVGGVRTSVGEGAIVTRLKITSPDGEALAVNPAGRSEWARRGGGIINNDEDNNNNDSCRGGGGA